MIPVDSGHLQPKIRIASQTLFYRHLWHTGPLRATILAGKASEPALQRAQSHIDTLCEFRVGQRQSLANANPRRKSAAFLAQVTAFLGASVTFGVGPAPRKGLSCVLAAQVPTLFPHLHPKTHISAPMRPYTCAPNPIYLRQKAHTPAPTPKAYTKKQTPPNYRKRSRGRT